MSRLILVSADSHAGLPAAEYAPYFDPQYRGAIEGYVSDMLGLHAAMRAMGYPFSCEELEVIDDRGAITSGGAAGYFDPKRRLRETEAEGVVAEILHPTGPISPSPFGESNTSRVSSELRAAGSRAHNRFLADFCSTAPGRLLGVAMTHPWPDIQGAADTVTWAKENGMVASFAPRFAGAEDDDLPNFGSPYWDRYWAACQEADLPVHIHAGHGRQQGTFQARVKEALANAHGGILDATPLASFFDDMYPERRPLWHIICGGVFDRFPKLRVVFAEVRADWIPPTLAYLDRHQGEIPVSLKLKPSEYWTRNCAATPSFPRASDMKVRHEIGIRKFMFATDYPHQESTWPNTADFLKVSFDGIPEPEARLILAENAIDFYGLDRSVLVPLAEKIGPRPEDVFGHADSVNSRLIEHFNKRNGFLKTGSYFPETDEPILAEYFRQDMRTLASY